MAHDIPRHFRHCSRPVRHQSSKFMLKTSTIFVTTIIVEVLNVAIAVQGLNQGQAGKSLLNSTVFGTPLEEVYGGNVEGLRNIRVVIDLEDVNGPVQQRVSPRISNPCDNLNVRAPAALALWINDKIVKERKKGRNVRPLPQRTSHPCVQFIRIKTWGRSAVIFSRRLLWYEQKHQIHNL